MAGEPADIRPLLDAMRQGAAPAAADLRALAAGLASGAVSDAQAGAFAMAVCRDGLDDALTGVLTAAMRDTGRVIDWDLPGPVLDKHSTGGIGDATSLVVAPILAALGAFAPLLSGRGLGHTGGTLDKLEALPGLETTMSIDRLHAITGDVGCAIAGATGDIAPADRRLYELRDETATVASAPLIVASILSKKLAGGADALVLDVKGGSGAFMKTRAEAEALAGSLVAAAGAAGCRARALITDMNQPLAPAAGNALEIAEVLRVLRDPKPDNRLCTLSLALAGELLHLGGLHDSAAAGARAALDVLHSGAVAEKFGAMVHAQKGPARLMDEPEAYLPTAPIVVPVPAASDGAVIAMDTTALGHAVVRLGGGRVQAGDAIDPRVGLSAIVSLGAGIGRGDPLAMVHAASTDAADAAVETVRAAIHVGADATLPPLVHGRVG